MRDRPVYALRSSLRPEPARARWIGIIILAGLLVLAPLARGAARLALLSADGTQETATCVDLFTAALTRGGKVELVERAELRRVLDEQKLTAANLTDQANSVQLGQLLRADGIVFLRVDVQKKQLVVRLSETRRGFEAYRTRFSLEKKTLPEAVDALAADILGAVGKLAADPAKSQLVAIIRIGNATTFPQFLWIEDELPELLAAFLSRSPHILLAERRQLNDLLTENEITTGPAAEFRAAGVLLDGELGIPPGAQLGQDPKKQAVRLTLRLWDAQGKVLACLEFDGTGEDIEGLVGKAAAALPSRLARETTQSAGTAAEAKLFQNLAQTQGIAWAAEAAVALSPNDEEAQSQLVRTLIGTSTYDVFRDDRAKLLDCARKLDRTHEILEKSPSAKVFTAFEDALLTVNPPMYWLRYEKATEDPEVRDLIRPFRKLLRVAAEDMHRKGKIPSDWLGYFVRMFFEDATEYVAYNKAYLERLLADPSISPLDRKARFVMALPQVQIAHVQNWRAAEEQWWDYVWQLTKRPEPEVRFMAFAALAKRQNSGVKPPVDAMACQREALKLGATVLFDPPEFVGRWGYSEVVSQLRQLVEKGPDDARQALLAAVRKQFEDWLRAGAGDVFCRAEPIMFLSGFSAGLTLPPEDAVHLIDMAEAALQSLAETPELRGENGRVPADKSALHTRAERARIFLTNANGIRRAILLDHPEMAKDRTEKFQILLSSRDPVLGNLYDGDDVPLPQRYLEPGRLLPDASTLWVAFWANARLGLGAIEIPSGRLLCLQVGRHPPVETAQTSVPPPRSVGSDTALDESPEGLSTIYRWGDFVCVGDTAGVFLFPAGARGTKPTATGVRVISATDGLPPGAVESLCGIGEDLYIVLHSELVAWNRASGKVSFLTRAQSLLPADAKSKAVWFHGITTDPAGHFLYVLGERAQLNAKGGRDRRFVLWRYDLKTKAWKTLADPIPAPALADFYWHRVVRLADGRLMVEDSYPGAGNRVTVLFDPGTEVFLPWPEFAGKLPPLTVPRGLVLNTVEGVRHSADFVPTAAGTIGVVPVGEGWEIVLYPPAPTAHAAAGAAAPPAIK